MACVKTDMVIKVIKLRGRPKKYVRFDLSYHEWMCLKDIGMVKVGGYLLRIKEK